MEISIYIYISTMEEMTSSIAQQLATAQQQIAHVEKQRDDIQSELVRVVRKMIEKAPRPQPTGVPIPQNIGDMVSELESVVKTQRVLQDVQDLQSFTRAAEKSMWPLERAHTIGDHTTFLSSLPGTMEACTKSLRSMAQLRHQLESGAASLSIVSADALFERANSVLQGLHILLSESIQVALEEAHWPPPFVEGAPPWEGFNPQTFAVLSYLCTQLQILQVAAEMDEFSEYIKDESKPAPLLWPLQELAAPLAQQLKVHFAQGLPTDSPDRPEWLFASALKICKIVAPHILHLQGLVEAAGLPIEKFILPLEMPKAIHAFGVCAILRSHFLPRLKALEDKKLWLHYCDEASKYDRSLQTLCGRASMEELAEDGISPFQGTPGSAIEVIYEQPEWREMWMEAEAEDAARQVDMICDVANAWQPAQPVLQQVESELMGEFSADVKNLQQDKGNAAQQELWPPECADGFLNLILVLFKRVGMVYSSAHRLAIARAVPLAMLKYYRNRLEKEIEKAEHFRDLLGPTWMPKVGAVLCAAHYVEESLRDPQGVSLTLEVQEEYVPIGSRGRIAQLVDKEAETFGAFRRQWSYKVAQIAIERFQKAFKPYKKELRVFEVEGEVADGSQPSASPTVMKLAEQIQALLRRLALHLDAIVYRDIWKSVALSVNAAIFNEIATEAVFSNRGAQQLDVDLSVLIAVFSSHGMRPAAYFKESKEAVYLLMLSESEARALIEGIRNGRQFIPELKALSGEHAVSVLSQRLSAT